MFYHFFNGDVNKDENRTLVSYYSCLLLFCLYFRIFNTLIFLLMIFFKFIDLVSSILADNRLTSYIIYIASFTIWFDLFHYNRCRSAVAFLCVHSIYSDYSDLDYQKSRPSFVILAHIVFLYLIHCHFLAINSLIFTRIRSQASLILCDFPFILRPIVTRLSSKKNYIVKKKKKSIYTYGAKLKVTIYTYWFEIFVAPRTKALLVCLLIDFHPGLIRPMTVQLTPVIPQFNMLPK